MNPVDHDLRLAREGNDYFNRRLAALTDADLDGPSLLPGWDRRHVVAHVGYNADALTRLVTWAGTGVQTPMYASAQARDEEIDAGATLPPDALRALCRRGAQALAAGWRDLPADRWDFPIRTRQGTVAPVSTTAWMRAREVWLHAVDLNNGGRFEDFPVEVVDRLLVDITSWWSANDEAGDLTLVVTDRPVPGLVGTGPVRVEGTAAQLARWASGRGGDGVRTASGDAVVAPRWL